MSDKSNNIYVARGFGLTTLIVLFYNFGDSQIDLYDALVTFLTK